MNAGDRRAFDNILICSRYDHARHLQRMEEGTHIIKRNKSMSAMDTTLSESLHTLRARARDGIVTLGYQTISMDDVSPLPQSAPPIDQLYRDPFARDPDDFTRNPPRRMILCKLDDKTQICQ